MWVFQVEWPNNQCSDVTTLAMLTISKAPGVNMQVNYCCILPTKHHTVKQLITITQVGINAYFRTMCVETSKWQFWVNFPWVWGSDGSNLLHPIIFLTKLTVFGAGKAARIVLGVDSTGLAALDNVWFVFWEKEIICLTGYVSIWWTSRSLEMNNHNTSTHPCNKLFLTMLNSKWIAYMYALLSTNLYWIGHLMARLY